MMARMETGYDMDFSKIARISAYQRFKFGSKIVKILKKSCYGVNFL